MNDYENAELPMDVMIRYNGKCGGGISNVSDWIPFLVAMERAGYRMKVDQMSYVQLGGMLINVHGQTCRFDFSSHWLHLHKIPKPLYGNKKEDVEKGMKFIYSVLCSDNKIL